jgi:hypothetical protein
LPEPIRVSAALKVTGLSGKILIQSFPPRRENLVMTRLIDFSNFISSKISKKFLSSFVFLNLNELN